MRGLAAALLLPLCGCTIVEVRSQGGAPHLSAWPFGVSVDRGRAQALSVNSQSFGAVMGCGLVGVGYQHCDVVSVDPAACGVAIIEAPAKLDRSVLARVSDQSRATCLRAKEGEP